MGITQKVKPEQKEFNEVTHELIILDTQKEQELQVKYKETDLYKWTGRKASESGPSNIYLRPMAYEKLLHRIMSGRGQTIAVLGKQGVGKGEMRQQLSKSKNRLLSLKFLGIDNFTLLLNSQLDALGFSNYLADYVTPLSALIFEPVYRDLESNLSLRTTAKSLGVSQDKLLELKRLHEEQYNREEWGKVILPLVPKIEKIVGKQAVYEQKQAYLRKALEQVDAILVDFPDYSRTNKSAVYKDITSFQKWWEEATYDPEGNKMIPNLVLFWQGEAWINEHFFAGKFDIIELKPFKPEEIHKFLREIYPDNPFTLEAMLRICVLSRGRMRLVKTYLQECLEVAESENVSKIDVTHVSKWITEDMLIRGIERELLPLFPQSNYRISLANSILVDLYENGPKAWKSICIEYFDGDRTQCSRDLTKLQHGGFIMMQMKSDDSNKKIVSIGDRYL